MAEDVSEELSAIRRGIRRIEDDVADLERKKAAHTDVEPLVAKQADMEGFVRTRLTTIQSDNDEIRRILKSMAESLVSIDDRLTKHKRETESEVQALKAPPPPPLPPRAPGAGLPIQIQIVMYILIGVGILALLQAAPGAFVSLVDRVT